MTVGKVWDEIVRHNDLIEFKKFADEIDVELYTLIAVMIMERFLWIYGDWTLKITSNCPQRYFKVKNHVLGLSEEGKEEVKKLFCKREYDYSAIDDNNDIDDFKKAAKILFTSPNYIIVTLIYFGYFYLDANNVLTPVANKNNGYWTKDGNKITMTIEGLYLISDLIERDCE